MGCEGGMVSRTTSYGGVVRKHINDHRSLELECSAGHMEV